jgi:hypothetical protein
MGSVVADTHALVWDVTDRGRLSQAARSALDQTATSGDPLLVAAQTEEPLLDRRLIVPLADNFEMPAERMSQFV